MMMMMMMDAKRVSRTNKSKIKSFLEILTTSRKIRKYKTKERGKGRKGSGAVHPQIQTQNYSTHRHNNKQNIQNT